MRIIFIFIVTSLFYLSACKKGPQCDPEIVSEDECEMFSQRTYPVFDIAPESEAYYTAVIEGNKTSVSVENEGMAYSGSVATRFVTAEPSLDPSKQEPHSRVLSFSFYLYKSASLVGKAPGILSIWSPPLPKTSKISLSFVDSLLTPGVKYVDCGDPEKRGWNIYLSIHEKITDPEETSFPGTPFFSMNRWAPSDFNHFEITKMEKKDLGDLMRYTIWVDFQADMHRHAEGKGKFFCRVENGKAKLFVDIRK